MRVLESTKNYIEYLEGDCLNVRVFSASASEDTVFTAAARMLCFADCTDIDVERIIVNGKLYSYAGWQPRMYFAFLDEKGEVYWDAFFPEWDH